MVRFGHLKIRNANPFKSVDLDLVKKGLVRVVGRNGAGKSSLWHLMTFLYYGIHPSGATKSEIAIDEKAKDFLIESSFEKAGLQYWLATAQKSKCLSPLGESYGTGFFLYRKNPEGQWENISWHKATDTQKLVKDILGWTLEEWYGYVYLAQQTVHTLIMGTKSDRQRYLSALFNMGPLDQIEQHYRMKAVALEDKVKDLEKKQTEITVLENMMTVTRFHGIFPEDLQKEIEDLKLQIEDATFMLSELDQEQKRYDEFRTVRQNFLTATETFAPTWVQDEAAHQTELESLLSEQAQFRAVSEQCGQLKQKFDQLSVRLGRLMVAAIPEDYETVLATPDLNLESVEATLAARKQLESRLTPVPEPDPLPADHEQIMQYADLDLLRTEADIAKIKARPAAPDFAKPEEEDLDMLRMDLSNATASRTFLNDKRSQYMIEGTCPTCGSELDEQHRTQKQADVDQELHRVEEDLKIIPQMLAKLTKERDAWIKYEALGPDRTAELPALEESVTRYKQKIMCRALIQKAEEWTKHLAKQEAIREIPALEESLRLYRMKTQYRTLASQIKERDLLKIQYDEMKAELVGVESKLAGLYDKPDRIKELKGLIERIKAALILKQQYEVLSVQNPADCSAQIQAQRTAVTEQQTKLSQVQTQLVELNDLIGRIQTLTAEVSGQAEIFREQKKCEILCKAYGKAGKIRQLQLSKMTNYLSDALTCHTYQHLPEHRLTFDVGDGIEINTSKNGCRPYDVSMMSGGEKGGLSGAFLFALDDMQPPDRRTSLKIIDELEAAFDKERKQDFLDYMLPALRLRAETVIVISHTPVEDQSLFDRTWEIRDGKVEDISGEVREYEMGEPDEISQNLVGAPSEPVLVGAGTVKPRLAKRGGRRASKVDNQPTGPGDRSVPGSPG